jgi:bifunctional non-homologous end joining protein LigD
MANGRFVIAEHRARRLHWDLRLERDGVLACWALPHGIPLLPGDNEPAIATEVHRLEHLDLAGKIPDGPCGAGEVTVWDRGDYEALEWTAAKLRVRLHGQRLRGAYAMFSPRSPSGGVGGSSGGAGGSHGGVGGSSGGAGGSHRGGGGSPVSGGSAHGAPDGDNRFARWLIHRVDPPEDPLRRPLPSALAPMLARAVAAEWSPADVGRWAFEIKWDGVRALAYCRPGRVLLRSRSARDITAAYPELAGLADQLGMRDALLDGEIVAFDAQGRPSFEALQRRMHACAASVIRRLAAEVPVVYAIFDILHLDGRSLLEDPWRERRAALESLGLEGAAWRVPAVHVGDAAGLIGATRARGLEGVVAKRIDSPYEPGRRSGAWRKLKHRRRRELLVGGWLPGEGRRASSVGSLLVGCRERRTAGLRYVGRVGSGIDERTAALLSRRLAALERTKSPFEAAQRVPRGARFVAPQLVVEVEFAEWTADGRLRAPALKGLRDDIDPEAVACEHDEGWSQLPVQSPGGELEVTVDGRRLRLTNPDKLLYPEAGYTKRDAISYYATIAPAILPHLRDRALTLRRYPDGVDGQSFYAKQAPSPRPDWVATAAVGELRHVLCQERPTLVWLANLAALELHVPLARIRQPGRATAIAFDLDPGEPAGLPECCEVALVLRDAFLRLGLQSFVKTSGSRGLHVYVPIAEVDFATTKGLAREVARTLERRAPDLALARSGRELRAGRVLVDWSQNDRHRTTVAPYSLRATPRPQVSTPLDWEEVERCHRTREGRALCFGPDQVLARWRRHGDLFAPVAVLEQRLPAMRWEPPAPSHPPRHGA